MLYIIFRIFGRFGATVKRQKNIQNSSGIRNIRSTSIKYERFQIRLANRLFKFFTDLNRFFHIFVLANNVFHQYSENGFEAKSSPDSNGSNLNCDHSDSSDSENENRDGNSPQPHRKSANPSKHSQQSNERALGGNANANTNANDSNDPNNDELAYVDTLPEEVKLVEVTSNLWGTKFKIHGLVKTVPANLGQVTYKTSFLHLQPRQMTLVITELRDDYPMHLKSSKSRFSSNKL